MTLSKISNEEHLIQGVTAVKGDKYADTVRTSNRGMGWRFISY